jgi:putative transposase
MMCRVLEVSTSGYYAWLKRSRSKRAQEDETLKKRIKEIYTRSKGTYGAPASMPNEPRKGLAQARM